MEAWSVVLFAAGIIAGALNAVAGGGTFITFPVLLFAGVPPIAANATSTVALWPGSIAALTAYSREVRKAGAELWWLVGASVLGGGLGGVFLVKTPTPLFEALVPFLLLAATLLFTFGPALNRRLGTQAGAVDSRVPVAVAALVQLGVAVYGGYFGGGMGMMMLANMTLMGMSDIHRMNGIKSLLAVVLNAMAIVAFIANGVVAWPQAIAMTGGAVLGGYLAGWLAQQISPGRVRSGVLGLGWLMTGWFFWRWLKAG